MIWQHHLAPQYLAGFEAAGPEGKGLSQPSNASQRIEHEQSFSPDAQRVAYSLRLSKHVAQEQIR